MRLTRWNVIIRPHSKHIRHANTAEPMSIAARWICKDPSILALLHILEHLIPECPSVGHSIYWTTWSFTLLYRTHQFPKDGQQERRRGRVARELGQSGDQCCHDDDDGPAGKLAEYTQLKSDVLRQSRRLKDATLLTLVSFLFIQSSYFLS